MFLQTINFVKISNHAFKQTWDYNGGISNKSHTCRWKHIHVYSGIIRHIPAHSDVIRDIPELFRHIRTYPAQLWYIQNLRIFGTTDIFTTLSKTTINGCNCYVNYSYFLNISLSRSLIYKMNIMNLLLVGRGG